MDVEEANGPDPMEVEEGRTAAPMTEDSKKAKLNNIMTRQDRDPEIVELWNRLSERSRVLFLEALNGNKDEFDNMFRDFFGTYWRLYGEEHWRLYDEERFKGIQDAVYNACVDAGLANPTNNTDGRLASLTHGLDRAYQGHFDLNQFEQKIDKTFDWYGGDHQGFISPSFAIIQSSGMGKTKLMKEYKTKTAKTGDKDVKLFLCRHGQATLPADHGFHFDDVLQVPHCSKNDRESRLIVMLESLEKCVRECEKTKIVLLFDEAHNLVRVQDGGFYVALRWWLRQKRSKRIVAVFAGTTLSLANYQRIQPSRGWMRDPSPSYVNYTHNEPKLEDTKKLYDPFYTFTTISMEHVRVEEAKRGHNRIDYLFDIRNCGYFGRPLFLAMLKPSSDNEIPALTLKVEDAIVDNGRNKIVNYRLYNIMTRMLLSESEDWSQNQKPVASVLATRVQLGTASYDFVTEATSKGYANLVNFRSSDFSFGGKRFGAASITFPPDPVCAALAMGLMQDSWSLSKVSGSPDEIMGKGPRFWVSQARMVFEQHLFLPNRGDAGEVFAALYMLLCGDVLRKERDPCMRKFEIDLRSWLSGLEEKDEIRKRKADDTAASRPSRTPARVANLNQQALSPSENQSEPVPGGVKLNFIQVVRNYFRTHAWFSQEYLKYMYDTAVACYVYDNCPAIDVVFPVKVGPHKYRPAFVSIKCWDAIGAPDMQYAMQDMKRYLESYRDDKEKDVKALCILIVVGSQEVGEKPANEGVFPREDAFVTVVVPKNDRFGVTDVIAATATASVRAEVLASHSFAHVEDRNWNALRASTTAPDREFGDALIRDQQQSQQIMEESSLD